MSQLIQFLVILRVVSEKEGKKGGGEREKEVWKGGGEKEKEV